MSAEAPPECQEMLDMGATLVLREVEDSWGAIQKDASDGRLRPMYTFLHAPPGLHDKPVPRASLRT
jgi:hypothetical protein